MAGHHSETPNSNGGGWIKLHRSLKDHPRYKDSEWVHVWIHLQLSATHSGYQTLFRGKTIMLKPGQLITGRFSISHVTGVSDSKVRRIIARLKSDHLIDQQISNKCSMITILNWTLDQKSGQQSEHSNGQQPATSKKVKKAKKGKELELQLDASLPNPVRRVPESVAQVRKFGKQRGFDWEIVNRWLFISNRNEWTINGDPIVDWKSVLCKYVDFTVNDPYRCVDDTVKPVKEIVFPE